MIDLPPGFGVLTIEADERGDSETKLTDEQIVHRLNLVREHMQEVHEFSPGDLMKHKFPKLATTKSSGMPVMFVRYLEKPISMTEVPGFTFNNSGDADLCRVFDCVIGVIMTGGGDEAYVEFYSNSAFYKPYEPPAS